MKETKINFTKTYGKKAFICISAAVMNYDRSLIAFNPSMNSAACSMVMSSYESSAWDRRGICSMAADDEVVVGPGLMHGKSAAVTNRMLRIWMKRMISWLSGVFAEDQPIMFIGTGNMVKHKIQLNHLNGYVGYVISDCFEKKDILAMTGRECVANYLKHIEIHAFSDGAFIYNRYEMNEDSWVTVKDFKQVFSNLLNPSLADSSPDPFLSTFRGEVYKTYLMNHPKTGLQSSNYADIYMPVNSFSHSTWWRILHAVDPAKEFIEEALASINSWETKPSSKSQEVWLDKHGAKATQTLNALIESQRMKEWADATKTMVSNPSSFMDPYFVIREQELVKELYF